MAIKSPESDIFRSSKSGVYGSEIFDDEYFVEIQLSSGKIKVWLNSNQAKPLKVWNGTSWDIKPVKFWNGTSWQVTSY